MLERPMLFIFAAALLLSGCDKSTSSAQQPTAAGKPAPAPSTNSAPSIPGWPPVKAQPRLQTMKLYVGAEVVTAELAMNQVQIATGMMFRTNMLESEGMLFVFARPHRASFYMRNTKLPLTAAYIDPDGVILELRDMKPLDETPLEAATDRVQYVLEMNEGWFKRHNIGPGTVIVSERGPFKNTFRFGP